METLKIYQKWEDMTAYLYAALRSYPKSERFTLAAETARAAFDMGTAITRANAVTSGKRRRAARRLRKLTRYAAPARIRESIMSFLGYMKHCSTYRSTATILNRTIIQGGSHDRS